MGLESRIEDDLKQATRERDQARVVVLRSVKNSVHNLAIAGKEQGKAVTAADWLKVIRSEIKKRQDAQALYDQGGRPELAAKESAEIKVLGNYLPAAPDAAQVKEQALKFKQDLNLSTPKDMGALTKALLEYFAGAIDGKLAANIAREVLS